MAWRSNFLPAKCFTSTTSFGWHHLTSISRDDLNAAHDVAKRSSSRTEVRLVLRAEMNAELELQTAVDTTTGRPKPMGKRGAFVADRVAGGPLGDRRPSSPVTRVFTTFHSQRQQHTASSRCWGAPAESEADEYFLIPHTGLLSFAS